MDELREKVLKNPSEIVDALRDQPGLLKYMFEDLKMKRKYVKLPRELEKELRQASKDLGLSEAVLLGLAAALFLSFTPEIVMSRRK